MTTTTTDSPAAAGRSAAGPRTGEWWKRTPGSALYLLAVFVLAIAL